MGEIAIRTSGKAEAPKDGKKGERAKSRVAWVSAGGLVESWDPVLKKRGAWGPL